MSLKSIQIIRLWSCSMIQFNCIKKSILLSLLLQYSEKLYMGYFFNHQRVHIFFSLVERGDLTHDIRRCWPPAWPSIAW